jgi:hypothetical protein
LRENNRNSTILAIKAALKDRGLRYSVTGGRGTSWGWLHIDLLPSVYKSLDDDGRKKAYRKLGDDFGEAQGYDQISVPAGSDYYREYIDRAKGLQPAVLGVPYWD